MFRPSGLLDHDLRLGLKKNQLQVQYQPIVDLKTGRCIGVEALTRWQHPDYGDVRPKAYVALAEQTGLISELTEWMLRRVVLEQEALLKQHQGLYIAVNCAASLLSSTDVEQIIKRVLRPSAIAPSNVVLEITEGVFLGDSAGAARETTQRLRQAGFRFALDDFGTGLLRTELPRPV